MCQTIKYPKEILGLDGFQVKVFNQSIEKLIQKFNIGFTFNADFLFFEVYDLNLKLIIDNYYMYEDNEYREDDHFVWLNKYLNKISEQLSNDSIIHNLYHEWDDTGDRDIEDFDFLFWGVLSTKRKILNESDRSLECSND